MAEAPLSVGEVMAEGEMRARVEAEMRSELEKAGERDRAMRALVISTTVALTFALPILAGVVGLCVRIFGAASGLY